MQNSVGYSCNDIWNKKKEREEKEKKRRREELSKRVLEFKN